LLQFLDNPGQFISYGFLLFQEGVFQVILQAVLPKYDIEVPESLNFNMCAAKDYVEATFEVKNSG